MEDSDSGQTYNGGSPQDKTPSQSAWSHGHGPRCKSCGQYRELKVDKNATMAKNQGVRIRPMKTNLRAPRKRRDKRFVKFY